jgi:hypothetical protein
MSVVEEKQPGKHTARAVFFLYAATLLSLSLVVACIYVRRGPVQNLFGLPFYVGETSWRLISGRGLSYFNYAVPNQVLWMRGARMPVATLYATAAILYLGPSQMLLATLLKAMLFLLPVLCAARMVLYRSAATMRQLWLCACVLAAPFLVPAFLADVVNLQVEEGFAYAFLAIAFTLVALGPRPSIVAARPLLLHTLATAAALDLLYLSKSSMILVVGVLAASALLRSAAAWSRLLLLLLVVAAPLGWALRQHAVSGRYAVGTSLDGGNFHKGNFEQFLAHYPPAHGGNLDFYEHEVEPKQPLGGEWAYNDWHNREALRFIRSHPRATWVGWEKKLYVFLFSFHVYGNGSVAVPRPIDAAGMVLFRLLLWGAVLLSIAALIRGRGRPREIALLYLAMVAACALPYIAGFGYTRHASVLLYPSAVAICLLTSALGTRSVQGAVGGSFPANS